MNATRIAWAVGCLAACLWVAGPVLAQQQTVPEGPAGPSLDAQYKAAQIDVMLATARLGLVQAQMHISNGQFAQGRQELDRVKELLDSLGQHSDVTPYKQVLDKLNQDLARGESGQRRLAPAKAADLGRGYGNPKVVDPRQPGLGGQVDLAVGQARLAGENGYTNVPGTPGEMTTDPDVVKQRTLDHQRLWDDGRYAPAQELVDVGAMLELDRERVHYQYALDLVRDGARTDELLHVQEATVPPPRIMNYPANWQEISQARARYADGKLWESAPFKDADGKTKTVAIYDVSDLLFVPIFPGPSEYNVRRPRDPLLFWTGQDRGRDGLTHPPDSFFGPGYNQALYGQGPGAPGRWGGGGYYGYGVTDIIGSAYYFPFEADPIYQYRLAQRRARLLHAVNALLSAQQD